MFEYTKYAHAATNVMLLQLCEDCIPDKKTCSTSQRENTSALMSWCLRLRFFVVASEWF